MRSVVIFVPRIRGQYAKRKTQNAKRITFYFSHSGIVAVDQVMARLLSAIYIAIMVIVCLNILIAYLSNTFTSVLLQGSGEYKHAASNQCADYREVFDQESD